MYAGMSFNSHVSRFFYYHFIKQTLCLLSTTIFYFFLDNTKGYLTLWTVLNTFRYLVQLCCHLLFTQNKIYRNVVKL